MWQAIRSETNVCVWIEEAQFVHQRIQNKEMGRFGKTPLLICQSLRRFLVLQ